VSHATDTAVAAGHGERGSHAEASDDSLRDVRHRDDREREADECDAALDRGVVQDVLEVERKQEELRERDRADDRHAAFAAVSVRSGRSAAAAAATASAARSRGTRDQAAEPRRGERRSSAPAVVVARVVA
jgi:hypothetical protein